MLERCTPQEWKARILATLAQNETPLLNAQFIEALGTPSEEIRRTLESLAAIPSPNLGDGTPLPSSANEEGETEVAQWEKLGEMFDDLLRKLEDLTVAGAPVAETPKAMAAESYFFHTSQEVDVLERSACDGHTGNGWHDVEQRGVRVYEQRGASHRVELAARENETVGLDTLRNLTVVQDADFVFTLLYVASVLVPPAPLPPNRYAGGWIDLDDVMEKIGWNPGNRSLEERNAMRARLWRYLLYGDRAVVVGQRTGLYVDRTTGEAIPTVIESAIWRIMDKERPLQRQLFDEVPRRVEIVISKQWEALLTAPQLAQYLPLAEVLGDIPPNKVAGDWARSMGLALVRLWRRQPHEVLDGSLRVTREELLTTYTPKTRSVQELLDGKDPKRAVGYYRDALALLAGRGLIAQEGEPVRSVEEMLKPHGRQGWQKAWLAEKVDIRPGERMVSSIHERANAKPVFIPRQLNKPKRRGRPPKKRD